MKKLFLIFALMGVLTQSQIKIKDDNTFIYGYLRYEVEKIEPLNCGGSFIICALPISWEKTNEDGTVYEIGTTKTRYIILTDSKGEVKGHYSFSSQEWTSDRILKKWNEAITKYHKSRQE